MSDQTPSPDDRPPEFAPDLETGRGLQLLERQAESFLPRVTYSISRWSGLGTNGRKFFKLSIGALEIVLGFGTFLAGMIEVHDRNWADVVVGFISVWILLGVIWIGFDLYGLGRAARIKRILWHLGCCATLFYTTSSMLNLDSDNFPQWLPLVVDSGIGTSIAFQSISREDRDTLFSHAKDVLSSIFGCGCIQISLNRGSRMATSHGYELGSASRGFPAPPPTE